jgi:hypothetical protein
MCLNTILDESEAVLHGNMLQLIKLTRHAIQMHNDNSARPSCDGFLDGTWVNFLSISKRIDEHGFSSRIRDTGCARNEGMSRDNDFIPGTDPECKERKMDGGSPTVYPEHVPYNYAAIISELFFELVGEFASRESVSKTASIAGTSSSLRLSYCRFKSKKGIVSINAMREEFRHRLCGVIALRRPAFV